MLSTFLENLNVDSTRVYPPKPYVLLCGGPVGDINDPKPISLRDAFLRSNFYNTIKNAEILQIEEIQDYFEKDCPYGNLVLFERDIAQLSELVLLFSEAPGSFAELGSFSAYPEILEKLLVVIQAKYLQKSSFILKGPISHLRSKNDNSVFSITNVQVGVNKNDFSGVDPEKLLELMIPPIDKRLEESKSRTTFQKIKFGHRCKLYVGLLREFSVLKDDELIELFKAFNISLSKPLLNRITFCCKCVQWSKTAQAGFDRVHFALDGNEAAKLTLKDQMGDKLKRRLEIRDHWSKVDPGRISAQMEAMV